MIAVARTDEEIDACFSVMRELRPHLASGNFLPTIRALQLDGYTLVYLASEGKVVACAGYRMKQNLMRGTFLYVEDLVTRASERTKGHGTRLFAWLAAKARELRVAELVLDSGVQRTEAHAFYEKQGMTFRARHYLLPLN